MAVPQPPDPELSWGGVVESTVQDRTIVAAVASCKTVVPKRVDNMADLLISRPRLA
jgi:hypothetical protein